MQIRYHCPTDGCVALIEYEPLERSGPAMKCPRCQTDHPMKLTDSIRAGGPVDRCAVCGGAEFFVRKDFPQRIGLAVVVIFGATAVYFFRTSVVVGWCVLAAAVLLDLMIYAFIGRVTTCYRCRADYRRCPMNPAHEGFDLATSEKY